MRVGGFTEQVGERCPTGVQIAVLVRVDSVGRQPGFEGKIQEKIALMWESQQRDTKGKPFTLFQVLTNSSNEKSNMTAVYGALMGKIPTEAECEEGFDMDAVLGKAAFINVVPPKKPGGWPFITTVMPLAMGMPSPSASQAYHEVPKFVVKMLEKAITGQGAAPSAALSQQPAPAVGRSLGVPVNPINGQPMMDPPVGEVDIDSPPF